MDMGSYFHTGDAETILFYELHTQSTAAMVGACLVICLLAVIYEGIKFFREYLLRKEARRRDNRVMVVNHVGTGAISGQSQQNLVFPSLEDLTFRHALEEILSVSHFWQTLLFMLQVLISYFLMLIVMTYNVWLAISVFLGIGLGYCAFGWRKAVQGHDSDH